MVWMWLKEEEWVDDFRVSGLIAESMYCHLLIWGRQWEEKKASQWGDQGFNLDMLGSRCLLDISVKMSSWEFDT